MHIFCRTRMHAKVFYVEFVKMFDFSWKSAEITVFNSLFLKTLQISLDFYKMSSVIYFYARLLIFSFLCFTRALL
jgi:hypothetical protein